MEDIKPFSLETIRVKSEPDEPYSQINFEPEEKKVDLIKTEVVLKDLLKLDVKSEVIENIKEEKPNMTGLLVATEQEEKCVLSSLKSENIVTPDCKNDIKDVKIVLVDIKYCGYGDLVKSQCVKNETKDDLLNNDLEDTSSTSDGQDLLGELDHDDVELNAHNSTYTATKEVRDRGNTRPSGAKKKYIKPLKFTCLYCDKKFTQSDFLRRHIRIHTGEKPHSCHVCNKSFRTKCLRNLHTRIHTYKLKPFVCLVCSKRFNQKGALNIHITVHHGDGDRPFSCDQCKMSFFHKESLRKHILKIHLKKSFEEKPCVCNYCGKSCKSRNNLLYHIKRIHLNKKCYTTCYICGKTILTKSLNYHMRIHSNENPFECALCSTRFCYKSALQSHLSQKHSDEKLYKCSKCDKSFKSKVNRKAHMEVHHDDLKEKKFICEFCNKDFYRLVYLKRHMKIHFEENKTMKCDVCGYSCIRKLDMERHLYTHFGERPKPFKCGECGMSFMKNSHLVRHHISKHTDLRPYTCDQCDKSYKDPGSLKTHKNLHLNKVFTCEKCGFRSVNEHSFKRHLRQTHCKKN